MYLKPSKRVPLLQKLCFIIENNNRQGNSARTREDSRKFKESLDLVYCILYSITRSKENQAMKFGQLIE